MGPALSCWLLHGGPPRRGRVCDICSASLRTKGMVLFSTATGQLLAGGSTGAHSSIHGPRRNRGRWQILCLDAASWRSSVCHVSCSQKLLLNKMQYPTPSSCPPCVHTREEYRIRRSLLRLGDTASHRNVPLARRYARRRVHKRGTPGCSSTSRTNGNLTRPGSYGDLR